jgi:hypothetical protein
MPRTISRTRASVARAGGGYTVVNHHVETEGAVVRHLRRWGAVYVLLVLFLGSWLGHFFAELTAFTADQEQHGEEFTWSDFWPTFLASTLENWQSEWLQLVFQAILLLGAKHLIFKVDADDMERLEAKVDQIRGQLGIQDGPATEQR